MVAQTHYKVTTTTVFIFRFSFGPTFKESIYLNNNIYRDPYRYKRVDRTLLHKNRKSD